MFGNNPKRTPLKGDGNILEVQEIFPTLQGEGPYVGWPSVFIRLGGCNLSCSFCDTEFESYTELSLDEIISKTIELSNNGTTKLVVITGGEPFRQPIEKLCERLLGCGFKVQIETNGTLYRSIDKRVDVICSPKNTNGTYSPIRKDILEHITAFKFIISSTNPHYSAIEEVGQSDCSIPVYIQAMDEYDSAKNSENLALAVRLAQQNGYRLSMQIHKIIGIS